MNESYHFIHFYIYENINIKESIIKLEFFLHISTFGMNELEYEKNVTIY